MKETDKCVVVDLCNTVCDVNGMIEDLFSIKREQGQYRYKNMSDDFFRLCPEIFLLPEVFDYAAECLNMIKKQQYEIVYVTSRPIEAENVTACYLREHGFPEGRMIFTLDKASTCREIKKCMKIQVAFEDEPGNIKAYEKENIPVLVREWDYNMGMGKAFTWKNLYAQLSTGKKLENC